MSGPWYVLLTAGGEERRLPCTDPADARRRYPFLPAGPLTFLNPTGERMREVGEPIPWPAEAPAKATSEDSSHVASTPPPLPPPPPPASGERKLTRGQILHRERMARKGLA